MLICQVYVKKFSTGWVHGYATDAHRTNLVVPVHHKAILAVGIAGIPVKI